MINLSPVLTTPAINENPGKSVFTGVIDTAEQLIASVVNTVL